MCVYVCACTRACLHDNTSYGNLCEHACVSIQTTLARKYEILITVAYEIHSSDYVVEPHMYFADPALCLCARTADTIRVSASYR